GRPSEGSGFDAKLRNLSASCCSSSWAWTFTRDSSARAVERTMTKTAIVSTSMIHARIRVRAVTPRRRSVVIVVLVVIVRIVVFIVGVVIVDVVVRVIGLVAIIVVFVVSGMARRSGGDPLGAGGIAVRGIAVRRSGRGRARRLRLLGLFERRLGRRFARGGGRGDDDRGTEFRLIVGQ